MTFLDETWLGNTIGAWLIALAITAAAYVALQFVRRTFARRFEAVAEHTRNTVDDLFANLLSETKFFTVAILAIYLGSNALVLPDRVGAWLSTLTMIVVLIQVAIWGDSLIRFGLLRYQKRETVEQDGESLMTIRAISFIVRLVLFTIVLLLALDNIPGVDVTSLIASLGIGGIAVALAVQSILADLFASLTIALDKPFVIGDFIIVGDALGTIENIGLKTTRLRSLTGEQLVIANNDLLSSRIHNYKRMNERRVVFSLGVTYETPPDKLKRIPNMIREAIETQENIRFDRAHFKEYGDFALNFEIVYYMLTPDYTVYMDTQQAINLTLFQRFAEQGIEFAYPTQKLFVSQAQPQAA